MTTESEYKRNYIFNKHLQESWTASNWIHWTPWASPCPGYTSNLCILPSKCDVSKGVAQLGSEQHSTFTASKATNNIGAAAEILNFVLLNWFCWFYDDPFGSYCQRRQPDVNQTMSQSLGPDINWLNKPKWMISRKCLGPPVSFVETFHKSGKILQEIKHPPVFFAFTKLPSKGLFSPYHDRGRGLIPKNHQMPGSIRAMYLHGKLR